MIVDVPVSDWILSTTNPTQLWHSTTAALPRVADRPSVAADLSLVDDDWRLIAWADPTTPSPHALLKGHSSSSCRPLACVSGHCDLRATPSPQKTRVPSP